jgi:hypothetical protein
MARTQPRQGGHARRSAISCLLLCASIAHADADPALSWSGALRADYFRSSRTLDDERDLVGATAQVKAAWHPGEALTGRLEARATDAAANRSGAASVRLVEGYGALREARWDWRAGKQIIAWGRADGINPTDVVSPRDYTVLLPFDEDQRTGVWALSATYAWSPEIGITALWKPSFEPSTIPIDADARGRFVFDRPGRRLGQFGLRIDRAGGDLDASLSLFHGRSLLPNATAPDPLSPAGLRLDYPVITMLGADLARNFAAFGTRLELAYVNPAGSSARDEPGMRPNLWIVAGVDRTFYPELNVNLQLFLRRSWNLPAASLAPGAAAAQAFDAATFMQERREVAGATLRISNQWLNDTLRAEVFVERVFLAGDLYVQPVLTYEFTDALRGTLGGQDYAGHGPQFGPMRRNRGAFAELRYSF